MNTLMVNRIDEISADLESLTTQKLKQRLQEAFSTTAEKIAEIAAIVRILEDRGEDLDALRISMIDWFRRVAYGQVLPEVLSQYGGTPKLLHKIADLPIPDQRKLANGESVTVLTSSGGEVSERKVDPISLTSKEIRQVFGKGKIRNLTEQRGWLEEQSHPRYRHTEEIEPDVKINKKKRTVIVNGHEMTSKYLLYLLEQIT